MKIKNLVFVLTFVFGFYSQAQRCESLFATENFSQLTVLENNVFNQLHQRIDTELKKVSDTVKTQLKSEKIMSVDMLCVGAGPQCASASQVAAAAKKQALVVEATDTVAGTFFNKHFFINTVERHHLSQHPFPGTQFRLEHLSDRLYVSSQQLGSYIQAVQYASGVPVLFKTTVEKIDPQADGSSLVYFNDGSVVRAEKVLIGTGLGEQSTKVKNVQFNQRLKSDLNQTKKHQLMSKGAFSSESFLEQIKLHDQRGLKMKVSKNIVLIGNGDGARIALEGLLARNVELPEGFKVFWIGNSAKNSEQYIADLGNQERYAPLVKTLFDRGLIVGVDGRAQDVVITEQNNFLVKSAKINDSGEKVSEDSFEAATVIDSTGYNNKALNLVAESGQKSELVDVLGNMKDFDLTSTVLARKIKINDKETNVFLVGPSAGNLVTAEELKTLPARNPVAMYNNVPRTAHLVGQIFKSDVSFSFGVKERAKTSTLSFSEIWSMLTKERLEKLN